MHIAFITPEYPHAKFNGNLGGIATFTKNLAEQLVLENIRVSIFIYSQSEEFIDEVNGVKIHFVKRKAIKGFTWYTNRKYFNVYVNKFVKADKIDVLEAPEWTGFTAFMKFNCPLIIRLHGSDTFFCDLENRKVKIKNKFFERKALIGADKIVGVSNFVSTKTKELFGLKMEIQTIYNTIDVDKFIPNHDVIQSKTLLYFGTLVRKKGVLELAKLFNILIEKEEGVQLILLGKDNKDVFTGISTLEMMKNILSEKAKEKMTHIHAVPYKEVIHHIQQADIVLLPSFAEAFPMTWLEAMALEKKLVTSNIGWANELMIDGETGFMVSPKNSNKFARKTLVLLENKKKANLMAMAAREHLKTNFSFKKILSKNIHLYKSYIQNEI